MISLVIRSEFSRAADPARLNLRRLQLIGDDCSKSPMLNSSRVRGVRDKKTLVAFMLTIHVNLITSI